MSKIKEIKGIEEAIKKEGLEWQAGASEVAEMSQSDFKKMLGFVPGDGDESLEARESHAESNFASYRSLAKMDMEAFGAPSSFNLSNVGGKNYMTSVKNQGSCGSCVAFGTVAAVEGTHRFLKRNDGLNVNYSEAHLFYCHARSEGRRCSGSNGGWWVLPSVKAFKNKGVVDDSCYPYVASDQACSGLCTDSANRTTKITGYTKLTSIQSMKNWISTKGAVTACFTVYSDFYAYRSGVYRKSQNASREGGHCVCCVGYSDAGNYWICKNSWGSSWGDGGYFKIAYGQVGIDSEMYGINGIVDSGWLRNKRITGVWSNTAAKNAWVYISGEGWKRISNATETSTTNMLAQLLAAKGAARNVSLRIENGLIVEIYA
jgi:C1A family cysteine protease